MTDEQAIAETADQARSLLFDENGHPKGNSYFLAELTLLTVLRPASKAETVAPGLGQSLIDWAGRLYVYDAGIAALFLEDAREGDRLSDRVLCNAAAVMLAKTGGIGDARLRKYAAERLSGDIELAAKRKRGRSAEENSYRDSVIAGRLIPPLLNRYRATRNEATEDECACSITSQAMDRIGITLSEKRIAELWGKVPIK